jgi:MYXO-CTERM domain-containing protein
MKFRHSIIAVFGAALLLCSAGVLNAQQPAPDAAQPVPEADRTVTVDRDDDDTGRWGWLGLLGLAGLAGLMGRDRYRDRDRRV